MVSASQPAQAVLPSRMDYKFGRVAAHPPAHSFLADSASSSGVASPTHHKQSSLSLPYTALPIASSFSGAPTVQLHASSLSASSAPATTTHSYSRFPAVGPPRPFSSAQSVRPRIVRTQDEDEDDGSDERDDGLGSVKDALSETGSAFSAFSRSREELDKLREERVLRVRDEERRQAEEKMRQEKVAAVAQKATQMRLRAASAELAKRREEEEQLRAVVAQVQAREEKQRQEDRARRSKQAEQQRREQEQEDRRQSEERKEDDERQMEKNKEASMREEHSSSASMRPKREAHATSPPPQLRTQSSVSPSGPQLPPPSAASKRSSRSDLLASNLPVNPSYYPTHVHSLLSTAFLPPLSRLFKHYHKRAPSSSASPAYVDMAGGVRASVLSSADWLLMMSECGVSGVLLPKDGLKRLYMLAVRTERKRSSVGEAEVKEDDGDERRHGLGLGRFLKSLWCVARSVAGSERQDDSEGGRREADVRVMLALLEYIRHHATPQKLGAQLKLQWPDMTLKDAIEAHGRAIPISTPAASMPDDKTAKKREKLAHKVVASERETVATAAAIPSSSAQPPRSSTSLAPAASATPAHVGDDDAASRERKERKRLRLKLRVEQYRREQEERDRAQLEEERRKKSEEDEREAERRRREERTREEEKRRIAEFKARRKEEVEEMARAEAEKAEREERERKRALELYMREKAERKRREEAEQRQRLMQFHQQVYAQEEAAQDEADDGQRESPAPPRVETKRRQWNIRPEQQHGSNALVTSRIQMPSPSVGTELAPAALPAAHASVIKIEQDDLLSVGGESAGQDSVDPNEETF